MEWRQGLLLMACGTGMVCAYGWPKDERWPVKEEETITRELRLEGEPRRLAIENIEGYVHVRAGTRSTVSVTAHKVIRAESDADLQEAKRDVKLSFAEQAGRVDISYDAPWVCRGSGTACRGEHRHFYNVRYDIDLQTPAATRPVISTVNGGDIRIDGTTGDFEVSDVNGGIEMKRISGSGQVRTVNGPVEVEFARNPQAPASFASVNGTLTVTFQPELNADLLLKTMNGQILSDFDVQPRATRAADVERSNGRFVYRSNGTKGARIGQGGPELSFNTLNGNVYLRRAK